MSAGASLATLRLQYVHAFRDRHGHLRHYFRRPGFPRAVLPGPVGSESFMLAYQLAMGSAPAEPASRFADRTLGALALRFFQSAEFSNLSASSRRTYRKIIDPLVREHGHRLAGDLATENARAIIERIGTTRPGIANLTRKVLRLLMAHAIALGWRRDNPIVTGRGGVPTYKLGVHRAWTDEEMAAFEGRWPLGTRQRVAYAVLLFTGQRVSDAVRMRRSDITKSTISVVQKKTGAALKIPLHPILRHVLRVGPTGFHLIGDKLGKPIGSPSLSTLIRRAVKEAGLPSDCVAHGLRKTALRRLAEHGASTKQIAAVSGHKSLAMIQHYTDGADQARLAAAAMAKIPHGK